MKLLLIVARLCRYPTNANVVKFVSVDRSDVLALVSALMIVTKFPFAADNETLLFFRSKCSVLGGSCSVASPAYFTPFQQTILQFGDNAYNCSSPLLYQQWCKPQDLSIWSNICCTTIAIISIFSNKQGSNANEFLFF